MKLLTLFFASLSGWSAILMDDYHLLLNRIEDVHGPLIQAQGSVLSLMHTWNDTVVGVLIEKDERKSYVAISGGVARLPLINNDAFTHIACSMMGRFLGGAPKQYIGTELSWDTSYGQSDYYVGLKCIRRMWAADDNVAIMKDAMVDPIVREKCGIAWSTEQEQKLCERSAMAGLTVAQAMHQLRLEDTPGYNKPEPKFSTPDPKVVRQTYRDRPTPQCRLDTYLAGAICKVDVNEPLDDEREQVGTCTKKNGYTEGLRPACWFKEYLQQ